MHIVTIVTVLKITILLVLCISKSSSESSQFFAHLPKPQMLWNNLTFSKASQNLYTFCKKNGPLYFSAKQYKLSHKNYTITHFPSFIKAL
jgi:hypothetical protein